MKGENKVMAKRISQHVHADLDSKNLFFTNDRGMNINGNRTIHMQNWKLEDLKAIVMHLEHLKQGALEIGKKGGDIK